MFTYFLVVLVFLACQTLYKLYQLHVHILAARHTGLPYTFSLIHELEIWAYLTDPILRRACRARILRGEGWPRWARFMVKDWHYEDRRRAHEEFGAAFLVVSPAGMVCYVGEADAAVQVLTRRKAFVKPREKMSCVCSFLQKACLLFLCTRSLSQGNYVANLLLCRNARAFWSEHRLG